MGLLQLLTTSTTCHYRQTHAWATTRCAHLLTTMLTPGLAKVGLGIRAVHEGRATLAGGFPVEVGDAGPHHECAETPVDADAPALREVRGRHPVRVLAWEAVAALVDDLAGLDISS